MSDIIPTAEEFLNTKYKEIYYRRPDAFRDKLSENRYLDLYVSSRIDGVEQNYPEMMVEFTKLHVKAALEIASKNVGNSRDGDYFTQDILNSYPLDNIK